MWDLKDCAKNSDNQLTSTQDFRVNFDLNTNKSILDFSFDDDTIPADDTITHDFATKLPTGEVVDTNSSPTLISSAIKKHSISKYPNLSIISCGGEGDTLGVLEVFSELIASESWTNYFNNFPNPHFFHGLQDYKIWLQKSGFEIKRLELVQNDITQTEWKRVLGWIRNACMPFKKCVSEGKPDNFITQFVNLYLEKKSLDPQESNNTSVVRLEVDVQKIEQALPPLTHQSKVLSKYPLKRKIALKLGNLFTVLFTGTN